jgi:LAS superfamily LD-carboxypeptidase LdcB
MIREILGKSISNKLFGLSKQDKEKEEQRKNTLLGVASLKIIAKNMLLLPRIGRDFKLVTKGFSKFLVNETGEKPAKESLLSRLAPLKDRFTQVKLKEPKEKREKKEKKRRSLLEIIFKPLITAATLLFTVFIFNKDLVLDVLEMYGGVEGIIGSALESLYSSITGFFTSFNFGEIITDEMSTFIEFISFGLITKDDATKVLESIGSFIKPVTDRVGYFIGGIADWVKEKLMSFGRSLDKGLGVETQGVKEERRKALEEDPYANAVETIKALDEDISLLKSRIISLKEYLENKKQYEQEKAEGRAAREAPTPPPAITPTKRVSDKSVFAPKEAAPSGGPLATPIKGSPSEVPSGQPLTKPTGSLDSITKKADPGVDTSKFNSEFQRRIELMASAFKQETGKMLTITSGYRSNEKQKQLYDADLAKNNGKPSGKVAQPMAPLGQGAGSVHMKGLGIDINSIGSAGLNELAGPRDKSKGWLEKFGLIRNVKGEDWHVTIAGAPATPDDAEVPDKLGNAVDVSTGKVVEGANIGKSSNEIAMEQRQQSKPQNPKVINAGITNNTTIISEEKILHPA